MEFYSEKMIIGIWLRLVSFAKSEFDFAWFGFVQLRYDIVETWFHPCGTTLQFDLQSI